MEIRKSSGIVLSSRTTGEGDIISTILTRQFGKERFVFKGLQKSRKRSLNASQGGSFIRLVYYWKEERETHPVNEYEIEALPDKLRDNLKAIYSLFFILESVEKTSGFHDQNTRIYKLLEAAIQALENTANLLCFKTVFLLYLVKFHGLLPDFSRCAQCGEEPAGSIAMNINDLTVTCRDCSDNTTIFSSTIGIFLNEALSTKFGNIDPVRYNTKEIALLLRTLVSSLEHIFNIELKSKRFVLHNIANNY